MIADASLLDILAADAALRLRVAPIWLAGTMPDDPIWPRGDSSRVYRGGDWAGQASYARSAYRSGQPPGGRYYGLGVRASAPLTP